MAGEGPVAESPLTFPRPYIKEKSVIIKIVMTDPEPKKGRSAYLIYQVPGNSRELKVLLKGARKIGARLVEIREPKRKKAVKK